MTKSITATFGKLLNTVGTVADAATKIVENTASGLDMLDMYVTTAKQKQEARTAVDMADFYEDLHKSSSLENAIKAKALEEELARDNQLKKHYETEYNKLETIINRVKHKYTPEA